MCMQSYVQNSQYEQKIAHIIITAHDTIVHSRTNDLSEDTTTFTFEKYFTTSKNYVMADDQPGVYMKYIYEGPQLAAYVRLVVLLVTEWRAAKTEQRKKVTE